MVSADFLEVVVTWIMYVVNFCGRNWLIMMGALCKHPCIHKTAFMSTKATADLLEVLFTDFRQVQTMTLHSHQKNSKDGVWNKI